jgi:outer membrane receptor for ferrienterochelin and colicin
MKYLLYILLSIPIISFSQEKIEGVILEKNEKNEPIVLSGANVFWVNASIGTMTDLNGAFSIPYKKEYNQLVISYIGYKTDTISVNSNKRIKHILNSKDELDEVVIKTKKKASTRSYLSSQNVINVSSSELLKAACCNLSESFETNPSIDVNFADALTGTREIKMLGLTSPYILIATENIPSIRGASQVYGMSFIPGTWVESIQITKGAGSVVNGFESIAGQINAELQKPSRDHQLFLNVYGNLNGRLELNTHLNTQINDKWDTGLYLHSDLRNQQFDKNKDTFLDMPLQQQINLMNRWQYTNNEKGFVGFLNIRFLNDEKQTGQIDFDPNRDPLTTNYWGSEIDTQRIEGSAKFGYVNPEIPYQSIGVQASYSNHVQQSYFGLNIYDITHDSFFATAMFNSIIGDSRNKFKTGISATYDDYNELVNTNVYRRSENSFGAFFEYSYDNLGDLNLTAGLRIDTSNLLGTFLTPRVHARYTPWEDSAFRISAGRGKRSANIFAENQKMFASSRQINILDSNGGIYGLDPEIAWNYGISFSQKFNVFGKKSEITFDYYRTDFVNQIVVDWENPREVNFYNLKGKSFANSFQAELNMNILEGFDFRTAYKYYNVKTAYTSGNLDKPLTPKHRVFVNVSYETLRKENGTQWKFDTTFNWLGEQRLSSTYGNPIEYKLPETTPTFATLNAQLTKVFSTAFEVYLGGENLTNEKQDNPILNSENPFEPTFDTTFVYGPIFGVSFYAGLRYKLN